MILLDTNVVSALIGEQTDRRVAMWANEKPAEDLWIPTVGLFEVRAGFLRMPPGRRRETLLSNFKFLFEDALGGRSVALDASATDAAATLDAERKARGFVVGLADTLIAGIALSRRATLATRNVRHFADLPTPVVDPWTA